MALNKEKKKKDWDRFVKHANIFDNIFRVILLLKRFMLKKKDYLFFFFFKLQTESFVISLKGDIRGR